MARTTVGDCIQSSSNHFELVVGVVSRAKAIEKGEPSDLPTENDRSIVLALREIAAGKYKVDLEAEILKSLSEDEELTTGQTPIFNPSSTQAEPSESD